MSESEQIELEVTGEERIAMVRPCLIALRINHELGRRNGQGPVLTAFFSPEDDEKLLQLWDEITDLRVRYIEARQQAVAEQLSYLEGQSEA